MPVLDGDLPVGVLEDYMRELEDPRAAADMAHHDRLGELGDS